MCYCNCFQLNCLLFSYTVCEDSCGEQLALRSKRYWKTYIKVLENPGKVMEF
jgi:hypothetical protein